MLTLTMDIEDMNIGHLRENRLKRYFPRNGDLAYITDNRYETNYCRTMKTLYKIKGHMVLTPYKIFYVCREIDKMKYWKNCFE